MTITPGMIPGWTDIVMVKNGVCAIADYQCDALLSGGKDRMTEQQGYKKGEKVSHGGLHVEMGCRVER
jgi:hypothetical protein